MIEEANATLVVTLHHDEPDAFAYLRREYSLPDGISDGDVSMAVKDHGARQVKVVTLERP